MSNVCLCVSSSFFGPRYLFYKQGDIFDTEKKRFKKLTIKNDDGYQYVNLELPDGTKKNFYVHRVIYMAFHSLTSIDPSLEVDHINGIRSDNNIDNLQLLSHKENTRKAHNKGTVHRYSELDHQKYLKNKNKKNKNSKTNSDIVVSICIK